MTSRPGESVKARINRALSGRERAKRVYEKKTSTEEGRAAIRADRNRRAAETRAYVAAYKVEKGCVDCGFNAHPAALHADHVRGVKLGNVAQMFGINKVKAELEKCEIRCANCHAIKTYEERREEPK